MQHPPKATSYEYGAAYQRQQLEKHRNRRTNHWRPRIQLAHDMVEKYVLPRFPGRVPGDLTVVDVGCSIGTMAIEFAQRGYKVFGVDFDESALEIARTLCEEEGVEADFVCADIAEWRRDGGEPIDIAVCFDIFEHLHDDELGALLQSIRRSLSPSGCIVFYTFPTQYDYLMFGRSTLRLPLRPLAHLPPTWFERAVRAYAALMDVGLAATGRVSYRDRIKREAHCNPTTLARLSDILKRSGFDVLFMESAQIYPFLPEVQRQFRKQPLANRNLYGVASIAGQ